MAPVTAVATTARGSVGTERCGARGGPDPDGVGADAGWGSVVDAARDLLAPLLEVLDPHRVTGPDAVSLYTSFIAVERLAVAGKLLLATRIAESGVWQQRGHRNAADLLAELEGVSRGQARSVIEVGERLTQLPATTDAVRQGTLSAPKVAELTGAGVLDPSREEDLLDGADHRSLQDVRERCRRSRATSAAKDPLETVRQIRANRFFNSWTDDEGAFCYQGRDTADRGAQILTHIGSEAARLRAERRAQADQGSEPERAVRADALFALVTGAHPDGRAGVAEPAGPGRASATVRTPQSTAGGTRSRSGTPDSGAGGTRSRSGGTDPLSDPDPDPDPDLNPDLDLEHVDGDRSDDGSVDDGSVDDDPDPSRPSADSLTIVDRPPTATVMVRVDLEALRRGHAEEGELCEIDGMGPIPVRMARDLMNDCYLRVAFHRAGDIRSIHHAHRTINSTLRTALVFRDTTCVVPGCGARTRLEIDHVIPVAEGGPTTLDNLCLLCHHHHFLKTFEDWTLERTGTGRDGRPTWSFTPPVPFGQEPGLGIDTPEARDRWRRAQE